MRSAVRPVVDLLGVVICVCLFLWHPVLGLSQQPSEKAAPRPSRALHFRRVLVVQEQLQKLADKSYLPMRREEFLNKLTAVRRNAVAASTQRVRIEQCEYTARYERGQLTDGQARLQIRHSGSEPLALRLDPCNLALRDPAWLMASGDEQPAVVGLDADGGLVVIVSQTGDLTFNWSRQGQLDAAGETRFDLEIPRTAVARIDLDLPAELEPTADGAVVRRQPQGATDNPEKTVPSEDDASRVGSEGLATMGQRNRWTVQTGGQVTIPLRLRPRDRSARRPQRVQLGPGLVKYAIAAADLQVSFEIPLQVHDDPLEAVTLDVGSELEIHDVRWQGQVLRWTELPGPEPGIRSYRVALDQPALGAANVLRAFGSAGLRVGHRWRLPVIRLREGMWREGQAMVEVDSKDLKLLGVTPLSGHEVFVESADPAVSRRIQFHSDQGAVSVIVARRSPEVVVEQGTTLRARAGTARADIVARVTGVRGDLFRLTSNIPAGWDVELVEADPADLLESFQVVPLVPPPSASDRPLQRQLVLQLKRPVPRDRGVLFQLACSKALRGGAPLIKGQQLPLVSFDQGVTRRDLVSIPVESTRQVELSGDRGIERIPSADLLPADRELVDASPGAMLMTAKRFPPELLIHVRNEPPRFTAEIQVKVDLRGDELTERFQIRCAPESTPLHGFRVSVPGNVDQEIQWRFESNRQIGLTARRVFSQADNQSAIWNLAIVEPQSDPFVVVGIRRTVFAKQHQIGLIRLPETTAQLATLVFANHGQRRCRVDGPALSRISREPGKRSSDQGVRGTYRYDPGTQTVAWLRQQTEAPSGVALHAWSFQLVSHWARNGHALHEASFLLENGDRRRVSFRIPAAARWHGIQINGKRVAPPAVIATEAPVVLSLPTGARFPVVQLLFETIGPGLDSSASLQPPRTVIDAPVLQRQWLVWLPSGYAPRPRQRGVQFQPDGATQGWHRRFLGPLLRTAETMPFRIRWFPGSRETRTRFDAGESSAVVQAAQRLSTVLAPRDGLSAPHTWGEWVDSYTSETGPRLWIDRWQLRAVGISPDTRLPVWEKNRSGNLARRVLERWDLRLVPHGSDVVISSRNRQSVDRRVGQSNRWLGAVTAQTWNQDGSQGNPWLHVEDAAPAINTRAGAFVRVLDWSAPRTVTLEIYRPGSIQSWAWAAFFLVVGWTVWGGARSPRGTLLTLSVAVLIACSVPDILDLVSAAIFLGVLTGIGVRLLWIRPGMVGVVSPRAAWRWPLWPSTAAGLTGAFIAAACLAEEPAIEKDTPAVYEVLFPIDKNRQPAGDMVYLPQSFYQRLTRLAVASQPSSHEWVITAANYRCEMQRDRQDRFGISQLVAVYDLNTRRPQQRIGLPLVKEEVQIADAHLDGTAIQTRWSAAGDSLEFTVGTQGNHRLELSLLPRDTERVLNGKFQIAIPRVPQSRVRFETVESVPGIKVESALGQSLSDEFGNPSAELGPTAILALSWSPAKSLVAARAEVLFEHIDWLRVRPGRVLLETRFLGRVRAGRVKSIQLDVDSRLRLLDQETRLNVEEVVDPNRPEVKTLTVTLAEESGDQFDLPLTFYLTGTSGVGKLTLPRVQVRTGKTTRHLFAVSVDDGLEMQVEGAQAFISMDPVDLVEAWSEAVPPPQLAYLVSDSNDTWGIMTRLRQPDITSDEQLDVRFDEHGARLEWTAQLRTLGASVWQYRLQASPALVVRQVEATVNSVASLTHWSRAPDGTLSLFLETPTSEPVQILLAGRLENSDPVFSIPQIAAVANSLNSRRLRIYRHPAVAVTLSPSPQWQPVDETEWGGHRLGWGRLCGSFLWAADEDIVSTPFEAQLRKNRPVVNATVVSRLVPSDGDWRTDVKVSFSIQGGTLDALRLELPAEDPPSLEIPSGTQSSVRPLPGSAQREVMLYPLDTGVRDFTVQLSSLLSTDIANSNLLIPVIPRDVARTVRYLVVPDTLGGRPLFWKGTDLRRVVVPPEGIDVPSGWTVFEVTGRSRVTPVAQEEFGEARVQLADHRVICDSARRFGASSFHLIAGRRESCVLEAPQGLRLLRVSVDGYPAELTSLGEQKWRLHLGRQPLPQRIEVVYEAPHNPSAPLTLQSPRLAGLEVGLTLWYVQGVGLQMEEVEAVGGQVLSAAEHGVARLRSLTDLLIADVDTARPLPYRDRSSWYLSWWQRYTETRKRLEQESRLGYPVEQPLDLNALDALWQTARERLEIVEQPGRPAAVPGPLTLVARLGDYRNGRYFEFSRDQATLQLQRRASVDRFAMWRVAAALLTLLMVGGLWSTVATQWNTEWLARNACPGAIVLGLVWWLWLSPSWMGWLIVCCSLAVAMRNARFSDRSTTEIRGRSQTPAQV